MTHWVLALLIDAAEGGVRFGETDGSRAGPYHHAVDFRYSIWIVSLFCSSGPRRTFGSFSMTKDMFWGDFISSSLMKLIPIHEILFHSDNEEFFVILLGIPDCPGDDGTI